MADIEGDENNNSLNGTSGSDNIKGKEGQDTLNGSGGSDTVSGGAGNDTIDGGSGNDTVYGGSGDDVVTGGSGDDVIIGGKGDDTLTAGNGSTTDTFVIRDGDGNDTITDFDPYEPDIIRFDMAEMNSYQDVLDRITTDGPDTIITYDDGSTTRLLNVNPSDLSSTNFEFGPEPVCIEAGARIATPVGPRPIECLRQGDLVDTRDNGPQPIAQIIADPIRFRGAADRRKPILIAKGALGAGTPSSDLVLSPQHRVLMIDDEKGTSVLVPAVKLLGFPGIRRMSGRKKARYFNLLLDGHEIVFANGCAVETLLLTAYARARLAKLNMSEATKTTQALSLHPIARKPPKNCLMTPV